MTSPKSNNEYLMNVYASLEQRSMKEAFDWITFLLSSLQNWQLKEKLNELEETYKMMLRYFAEGANDPKREEVFHDLLCDSYRLADSIALEINSKDNSGYYFESRRMQEAIPGQTSSQLIQALDELAGKQALTSLLNEEEKDRELIYSIGKQLDAIGSKIFRNVWLSNRWNEEEKNKWKIILSNTIYPSSLRCLIITGITLSLQETFDERKALVLLEACENKEEEIRQRALVGLLLFLRQYSVRFHLYSGLKNRLDYLTENKQFARDIRHIILQFILSKDTEKITRIIQEEILPGMMKLGPEINKKIKLDDLLNESGMDDKNPEWQKILDEAGLSDKLKEFSELQMEGADVMHSSFYHLKNYAFFNDISNWFLPFSIRPEDIQSDEMGDFVRVISGSTLLCNSDKYSFYYSISSMPESYRKMVTSQFSAENSAVIELQKEELPDTTKKINPIARMYIQDLYRFYKIYPRKKGFKDIFEAKPEFYKVEPIAHFIDGQESLLMIGEFYFNRNYYKEAIEVFDKLLQQDINNDVLFQKKGYCLQMQGKIDEALEAYLKAELLNASNSWTIKKIAWCYRMLKQYDDALVYYRKAEQFNPDNLSIQLCIGHCYLELRNYPEALKAYFKVEYLSKNKEKAWRPIAWCSFLEGKHEQAMDYFNRILETDPDASDFLNAGHTLLAMKRTKEAIAMYDRSINHPGNSLIKFKDALTEDIPALADAGIDINSIPFIIDSLSYGTEL